MRVYGDGQSGNCYKIKLLAALLGIAHEWVPMDILAGDTRAEAFLALNPAGQIPLLELDDGRLLAESNAILNYLADASPYLPAEAFARARVLQWQFFEQYSHEPYLAVARFINKYLGLPDERKDEYAAKQQGGHQALSVMERQLARTPYLCGAEMTIADISLYAYTHVAHEGGFELSAYPGICRWLERISRLPAYVAMA